jgi:hypothetical protein
MANLLNDTITGISYVGQAGDAAILKISGANANMLVDSVQVQGTRGVQLRHFLNGATAAYQGKGSGVVQLTGVFGSKAQMDSLLGTSSTEPCKQFRSITVKSGILKPCEGKEISGAILTLTGCMVSNFSITLQMQQDGTVYEQATVSMTCTNIATS